MTRPLLTVLGFRKKIRVPGNPDPICRNPSPDLAARIQTGAQLEKMDKKKCTPEQHTRAPLNLAQAPQGILPGFRLVTSTVL